MMKARVESIKVDADGHVYGVRVCGTDVHAPLVISDAGLINTFSKLLDSEIAEKSRYHRYVKEIGSGESAFQVFVGLRGTTEELNLKATNYWIYANGKDLRGSYQTFMAQKTLEEAAQSSVPVPVLFTSFPSTKDETWTERFPGGLSTSVIAGACKWDWFTERGWEGKKVNKRGDEYEMLKGQFGEKIMEEFRQVFPHLADKVEFWQLGTPLTGQYYLEAPKGEIAGMDHSPLRFQDTHAFELRPETDIKGLYLAGQDVAVCGFVGAMFGGFLAACSILERNLMTDLLNVKAQRKALYKKALHKKA